MRRHLAIPLLVAVMGVVAVAGCSSATQQQKTLTEVVTVTGASPAGGSVTVISPVSPTPTASDSASGSASGSTATGSPASGTSGGAAGSSSKPASSSASTSKTSTAVTTPTGKPKKVNVLKADCNELLDAQDVKKVLGVTISTAVTKIVDVANKDIGRTGLIRCRYGASSAAAAAPVSLALANYTSPALAQAQLKKTADSIGGTPSPTSVAGYPATVIVQAGGLLLMGYDTWTLSLAIADKLVPNSELPKDLTQLANMVFLRLLKTS